MKVTQSIWNSFTNIEEYPSLSENITTNVAIIGGGITGISVSKLLGNRGISNVVLESKKVGENTTSQSTGNLYSIIDSNLSSLAAKYNLETVRKVTNSRSQALEQMAHWINTHHIDCDFKRVPMFLYSGNYQNAKRITTVEKIAKNIGLKISKLPYHLIGGFKLLGQAQFNPLRYVQGLAKNLHPNISTIYEQTHVQSVRKKSDKYILQTNRGMVTARKVIHTTHMPKGVKFVQTLLEPYREYGIACKTEGNILPEGIFWEYQEGAKKFSLRIYERGDDKYLIVAGESHKVGYKKNNEECFHELYTFARRYFEVSEPEFLWRGKYYGSADLLPYIGPVQKNSSEYIATGYSTDGLVYSTIAAKLIADHICGWNNKWTALYRATRNRPVKAVRKLLKENTYVAKHFLKNLFIFQRERSKMSNERRENNNVRWRRTDGKT